jgi:hypothetical protein
MVKQADHVADIEIKNAYRILVWKVEGRKPALKICMYTGE